MSFHEVRFPEEISYGSSGGPQYSTAVIESESGLEQRVPRWADPRHSYDVSFGIKTPEELSRVREFYIARKGPASGFRFKDWQDFHSLPGDGGHQSSPGVRDQLIGVGTGTTASFQLVKRYASGPTSYLRRITKPVSGSVRVWVNGVEQALGAGFNLDSSSGLVTLSSPPPVGHLVEASFEFDVPVRFVSDSLLTTLDSFGHGNTSIDLVEVVDGGSVNVTEFFYGGSQEQTFGVGITITTAARVWTLSATSGGLTVSLPQPSGIPPGGPIFYVNNGGSHSFVLRDHLGSSLVTLSPGTGCQVVLSLTVGGTKVWYVV